MGIVEDAVQTVKRWVPPEAQFQGFAPSRTRWNVVFFFPWMCVCLLENFDNFPLTRAPGGGRSLANVGTDGPLVGVPQGF